LQKKYQDARQRINLEGMSFKGGGESGEGGEGSAGGFGPNTGLDDLKSAKE